MTEVYLVLKSYGEDVNCVGSYASLDEASAAVDKLLLLYGASYTDAYYVTKATRYSPTDN